MEVSIEYMNGSHAVNEYYNVLKDTKRIISDPKNGRQYIAKHLYYVVIRWSNDVTKFITFDQAGRAKKRLAEMESFLPE